MRLLLLSIHLHPLLLPFLLPFERPRIRANEPSGIYEDFRCITQMGCYMLVIGAQSRKRILDFIDKVALYQALFSAPKVTVLGVYLSISHTLSWAPKLHVTAFSLTNTYTLF